MSNYRKQNVDALHNYSTGALLGFTGADGNEYLVPVSGPNPSSAPTLYVASSVAITGGTINGTTVGATTPAAGRFTQLTMTLTDSSGTPGNVTNNAAHGRVAIAAAASSVVVTNSLVTTTSTVLAVINQAAADATLTQIVRVNTAAGSFTITGNAAATANTVVDYVVIL